MRNEECWNIKIAFFFVVMRLVYDTSIESKAKEKYAFALKSVFYQLGKFVFVYVGICPMLIYCVHRIALKFEDFCPFGECLLIYVCIMIHNDSQI